MKHNLSLGHCVRGDRNKLEVSVLRTQDVGSGLEHFQDLKKEGMERWGGETRQVAKWGGDTVTGRELGR